MRKKGRGKVMFRKTGGGKYETVWIYIPSKLSKDSSFPFNHKEDVDIELTGNSMKISKIDEITDLINSYGIKNATLSRLVEQKARENGRKIFLFSREGNISYQNLHENSNRIANGILKLLKEMGMKKTNIALMFTNSPEFLFCWFGIVKAGCIFVPINYLLEDEDLAFMINDCNAEILILDYQLFDKFKTISKKLTKLKKIIIKGAPKNFKFIDRYVDYEKINILSADPPKFKVRDMHRMEIMYTAGTTGRPKGITVMNHLVLAGLIIVNELKKIVEIDNVKTYCPLPLFHPITQILIILPTLFYDSSVIITREFKPSTFWEDVKKYKPAILFYKLGILTELLNEPAREKDRNHSIKWALGSEAYKEIWEIFEHRFGIAVHEGWTLSEAVGMTLNKVGSSGGKIGSIGTPIPGFEMKIIDSSGNELPPGPNNVGEIVSRATLPFIVEFHNRPEEQALNFDSGRWFHTGDYGYKDDDGYFYMIGRKEHVIRKKNKILSPNDVEKVLNAHPFILESAAIGLHNETTQEDDIKICVVLKEKGILNHEDLYNYLLRVVVYYMVPRYIEFKEKLPKTADERIRKFILKEEMTRKEVRRNTWDAFTKDFLKK
ncbi:MAG: AMP-binding protein [Candidatus Helarchaeota archaeon]